HFDKVAFRGDAADAGPVLVASEQRVHQVAELVEEGDDVGVFHEAGVTGFATRKVAYQRCFGNAAAVGVFEDSGNKRVRGKPLVLAFARVHVQVEAAYLRIAIINIVGGNVRVPGFSVGGGAELHLEEARGGGKHSLLDAVV